MRKAYRPWNNKAKTDPTLTVQHINNLYEKAYPNGQGNLLDLSHMPQESRDALVALFNGPVSGMAALLPKGAAEALEI